MRVDNDDNTAGRIHAYRYEPLLTAGTRVLRGKCKWIMENRFGIREADAEHILVRRGLSRIPDDSHDLIIYIYYAYIKILPTTGVSQGHYDSWNLFDAALEAVVSKLVQ